MNTPNFANFTVRLFSLISLNIGFSGLLLCSITSTVMAQDVTIPSGQVVLVTKTGWKERASANGTVCHLSASYAINGKPANQ